MRNRSVLTEFILLGFSIPNWLRTPLFSFAILLYVFIICSNIMIIMIVKIEPKLHIPMYFFITNFSFLEIWYTTVTVPRMIRDLIMEDTSISFNYCIVQLYCFLVCGANEHCLLAVLAYDRFIAICRPLQYGTIMKQKSCLQMVVSAWLVSFLIPTSTAFSFYTTKYCGVNINHFFCDVAPLLQITCGEDTDTGTVFYTLSSTLVLSCFFMICASYIFILYTVLHIKSHTALHHALSTCASHLTVVTLFYSSCMFMYVRPSSHKYIDVDKHVAIAYIVVAPILNPMIYTFRNKAMKSALKSCIKLTK